MIGNETSNSIFHDGIKGEKCQKTTYEYANEIFHQIFHSMPSWEKIRKEKENLCFIQNREVNNM
jgi:hypothetical protein